MDNFSLIHTYTHTCTVGYRIIVLHSFLLECCTHPSTHPALTCSLPMACFVDFIEKTEVVQSGFHLLLSSVYHLSYSYSLPLKKAIFLFSQKLQAFYI